MDLTVHDNFGMPVSALVVGGRLWSGGRIPRVREFSLSASGPLHTDATITSFGGEQS